MNELTQLLSSTEESLKVIAAKIERLGQIAEEEKQRYVNAFKGEKTAIKAVWEAAARDKEAARRVKEALRAEKKALIEKLPAAGERGLSPDQVSGLQACDNLWEENTHKTHLV